MDITERLLEVPTMGHDAGCVEEAATTIDLLREALKPFAAIDLLECRLPPEFAIHVLRARGALTHNK